MERGGGLPKSPAGGSLEKGGCKHRTPYSSVSAPEQGPGRIRITPALPLVSAALTASPAPGLSGLALAPSLTVGCGVLWVLPVFPFRGSLSRSDLEKKDAPNLRLWSALPQFSWLSLHFNPFIQPIRPPTRPPAPPPRIPAQPIGGDLERAKFLVAASQRTTLRQMLPWCCRVGTFPLCHCTCRGPVVGCCGLPADGPRSMA